MVEPQNRYSKILERIFNSHHQQGMTAVDFTREEMVRVADELGIALPKNLGDLIYSFRFRVDIPASIAQTAPSGSCWVIQLAGHGLYRFRLRSADEVIIKPDQLLVDIKIPDATPGIVSMYAMSDEQALLAKVRYNRLLDIFIGITCYSLQNHLRTTVKGFGQVETDELYIGIDRFGGHYTIPVQAKGCRDRLGLEQIEQDIALCHHKYPKLTCRPVAAQFLQNDVIALFEFAWTNDGTRKMQERHYRLVPPEQIDEETLNFYLQNGRNPTT